MKTCQQSNNKGFTLIELMMTLAIAGVLLSIALFSTTQMTAKEKANNFSMEFKRHLKFARAKAMTTGDPVIVCAMANPGTTGACATDWQTGTIIMFADVNDNGSFESTEDILLRSVSSLVSNSQLRSTSNETKITFDQRGQVADGQSGNFIYCPTTDNKYNVQVQLMASGTVRDLGETTLTCGT
ncbi:GspH/FimT family pseudopilin [Pseudoalteromonas pernae]|uniref:GspH/FimT family pseudopilin n=1 Tax=Pseudoalteromonas pernae TaxID=3118054 RepID=UPI003242CC0E